MARKSKPKAGTSKASAAQRRVLFADAYIANGENATQAAVAAGYKPGEAAKKAGYRLSKDVHVQALIAEHRKKAQEASGLTVEKVLRELGRIALFDPRRLFRANGTPIDISDLDDDTAAALAGVEVEQQRVGKEIVNTVRKYRIAGKNEALANAMKHLGLFKEDNKQRTDALAELLAAVDGHGKLDPRS